MEKKQKWEIVLMAIFLAIGVACAVCLIIFSNQMFLYGSTSNRILGIVLLAIGFIISIAMFSAVFTSYRFDKKKPIIKYEEIEVNQDEQEQPQENSNNQENI